MPILSVGGITTVVSTMSYLAFHGACWGVRTPTGNGLRTKRVNGPDINLQPERDTGFRDSASRGVRVVVLLPGPQWHYAGLLFIARQSSSVYMIHRLY